MSDDEIKLLDFVIAEKPSKELAWVHNCSRAHETAKKLEMRGFIQEAGTSATGTYYTPTAKGIVASYKAEQPKETTP